MNTAKGPTTGCEMVDRELDRQPGRPDASLSAQARRHVEECERCRALYRWLTEGSPAASGSPELYGRIEGALNASLRPVAVQASTRSLMARFWILFLLLAGPAIVLMGLDGLRHMDCLQRIAITTLLVLAGVLLSLSLAWQMTPGSLQRIPARTAVTLLAAAFLLSTGLLFPWRAADAFLAPGWHCLKTGLILAAPAAVLFLLLARRGAPLAIRSLGGTVGALAGLFGATVLQFTCSRQEARHLLVWHGGVLLASILIGVLMAQLVRSFFRQRS